MRADGSLAKVGIIVPFRDLDVEQSRQQHLNVFIPSLTKFMEATSHPFCIYIIEQSDDGCVYVFMCVCVHLSLSPSLSLCVSLSVCLFLCILA